MRLAVVSELRPESGWRRAEEVRAWANTLRQPKHLVLTSRNHDVLTRSAVGTNLKAIAAIRRRRLASNWTSGTWTMELTNEGRGWHLHFHLLIESRWIDTPNIARAWAQLVGQDDAAIVWCRDARAKSYCAEVAKYIAEAQAVAAWSALDIAQAMDAMHRHRAFGVFGSAFGARTEWRRQILAARHERSKCTCGACNWHIEEAWKAELEQRHK